MAPTHDPGQELARRLRELRERVPLTQSQLADALGVSVASISSWEGMIRTPPPERLEAYARFFALGPVLDGDRYRLVAESELTSEDRDKRDKLRDQLKSLRPDLASASASPDLANEHVGVPSGGSSWEFPDEGTVTIVCSELPPDIRVKMPYADPNSPDYVESYAYADLDALIELHGHVRTVNGLRNQVNIRLHKTMVEDDLTTHLVLLGGVDWNTLTSTLQDRLSLPVKQFSTYANSPEKYDAWFGVGDDPRGEYRAVLAKTKDGEPLLREDVALFFRAPNPFNRKRTITICNGINARGTYGAVRASTDARFRDRNEEYVASRFRGKQSFGILMRVRIFKGRVITPDWTQDADRLYEWSDRDQATHD